MASSEYDALLESTPAQKSEYDALLAQPTQPSQPKSSVLGEIGTAIKNTAVGFVKGLARPPSLAEIALPIFGGQIERQYEHAKTAEQAIRSGQPAAPAIAQAYAPNVSELVSPVATRGQKIQAGVNIAAEVAPFLVPALRGIGKYGVAGRSLSDIALGAKPEPLAAETAAAEQIQKGGEISATQERVVKEGNIPKYPGDDTGRPPAETSGRGGNAPSPQAEAQAPQVAPAVPQPEQAIVPAHEATKEQVIAGHPELAYQPDVLSPGTLASRRGEMLGLGKKTIVGDKFFDLPTSERQDLLLHETGHDISGKILADSSQEWTKAMEPLRIDKGSKLGVRSKWENPVGFSQKPEEVLADIYYDIKKNGMPDFQNRELWSKETAEQRAPIYDLVNRYIQQEPLPVSEGGAGIQPPISKEISGKAPPTASATVTTGTGEGVSQPTETTPAVTEPTTAAPVTETPVSEPTETARSSGIGVSNWDDLKPASSFKGGNQVLHAKSGDWIAYRGMFANRAHPELEGHSIAQVVDVIPEGRDYRAQPAQLVIRELGDNNTTTIKASMADILPKGPSEAWISAYVAREAKFTEADARQWYSEGFRSKKTFTPQQSAEIDRYGIAIPEGYVKTNLGEYVFDPTGTKGVAATRGEMPKSESVKLQQLTTPPVSEAQPATTAQALPKTVEPPPPETPEELGQALKEPARLAGPSNRVLQERAARGEIPQAPESGVGILKEDLVNRSRAEYSPERAAVAASKIATGESSLMDEGVAVVHEEALTKAAADAERALKANPTDPALKQSYEVAQAAMSKWQHEVIQPMKTNWSNKGINLQGATDVDTGSLVGLQKLAWDTGKGDFTPEQRPIMDQAANRVSKAMTEEKSAIGKANETAQKLLKPSRYLDLNQLRESLNETLKTMTCG